MPHILVVCTGNICRSPMAEGFLRVQLSHRLGDRAPSVSSAGLVARGGSPAEPDAVQAAADLGADIAEHAARRLTIDAIERADLVLGMASEHRAAIVETVPEAAGKTFTLKELVRLLEALPPAPAIGPESSVMMERVRAADELRHTQGTGRMLDEDIRDPLGLSFRSFRWAADELHAFCSALVDGLFGSIEGRSAAGAEGV